MDRKDFQCRVCLNDEGVMIDLFITEEDKPMISTRLMCLAKVRIYPGDGLPAQICSICLAKLNHCTEFIQICEESDLKLRMSGCLRNEEANTSVIENNEDGSDNEINIFVKVEDTGDSEVSKDVPDERNIIKNLCEPNKTEYNLPRKERIKCSKRKINKIRQQCNICGRVMSSRHRLKTHLVTHSGERPFSCLFCNKAFSLDANLKVHLRIHTGEKPFQCTECEERFAQSSGLIAHKRKHTGQLPYKCMLCPRSFRTIGHLQYHTKRHTGEKNFECEKCGRAFITRGDLKQHMTTHSGDRSHVCSVCGLRLTRASNLKRHMQQHRGKSENRIEETGEAAPCLNKRESNASTA